MEGLKNYALALVTICVSAGLVTQLAPEGALKKYLKYLVSLCVLAALLSPVLAVFGNLPDFSEELLTLPGYSTETTQGAQEQYIELQRKAVEESVGNLVSSKFGIGRENIKVEITLDASNTSAIEIRKIKVSLSCDTDSSAIEKYLDEMFYGTAKIEIIKVGDGSEQH